MAEVLFVSKPVTPPWNDSSKNLVRDVAGHLQKHTPVVMRGSGEPSSFSPRLGENLDVLRQLLWESHADLWHFFFAPNRKSSGAGRFAATVRRVPTVHTVCSLPPEGSALKKLLFADVTVALSRFSYDRFAAAGVDARALRLVPPCVPALPEPTDEERAALRERHGLPRSASVWIYPGDLEHGGGADVALEGFAAWNRPDAILVMACREKTPKAAPEKVRLVARAKDWRIDDKLRWVGETPHIHELLALSDFTVLPNRSPYAKMDYPLVVLEAMCLGRPVVVGEGTPAEELADAGGAIAVETTGAALAEAIERLSVDADADARRSLGARARDLVLEQFSPAKVASAYETLYEEIRGA
jgi:phosphatidylinositol alpha-1,6-mannosyltransferase